MRWQDFWIKTRIPWKMILSLSWLSQATIYWKPYSQRELKEIRAKKQFPLVLLSRYVVNRQSAVEWPCIVGLFEDCFITLLFCVGCFFILNWILQTQLDQLMESINTTNPHWIRCVKPNMVKKPVIIEGNGCIHQLRCAGEYIDLIQIYTIAYLKTKCWYFGINYCRCVGDHQN